MIPLYIIMVSAVAYGERGSVHSLLRHHRNDSVHRAFFKGVRRRRRFAPFRREGLLEVRSGRVGVGEVRSERGKGGEGKMVCVRSQDDTAGQRSSERYSKSARYPARERGGLTAP